MTLDFEILQFFAYKKVIKRKQINPILAECQRLNVPAEKYLIAEGHCTEITALSAIMPLNVTVMCVGAGMIVLAIVLKIILSQKEKKAALAV